MPSILLSLNFCKTKTEINKKTVVKTRKIISKTFCPLIGTSLIIRVEPKTKSILKMLEPTTFPIAISLFFLTAAVTLVANSGRLVPTATMVSPIKASETPSILAIAMALSVTKNLAERLKKIKLKNTVKLDFQIGISLISTLSISPVVLAIPKT